MNIRMKILICTFAAFLVITIPLGMLIYSSVNNIITNQVQNEINGIMLENKQKLNDITNDIARGFVAVKSNETIAETVNNIRLNYGNKYRNKTKLINEYKSIFDLSIENSAQNYTLRLFVDKNLKLSEILADINVNPYESNEFGVYTTSICEKEEWYKDTIKSNMPYNTFQTDRNPNYIYFSNVLYCVDSETGKSQFLGVGVVGLDCVHLLSGIKLRAVTGDVNIAVLDSEKNVICKSSNELSNEYIEKIVKREAVGFNVSREFNEDNYLVNIVSSDAGISYVSFITMDSIRIKANDMKIVFFLFMIIVCIASFFILNIISYYLTKPIKKLSDTMKNINYDNLSELHIKKRANDEVGTLYNSFNNMISKLEESINRENEQRKKAKKLEIQMFQAQINPHYIRNVLDSISWLALENKQDEIVNMVDLLSYIVAYSIKDGAITAKLSEEMECVEKYIELQKNRYSETLSLEVNLPDEYKNIVIPKCILQPIVENSIIHGMNENRESIFIKIYVESKGKNFDIVIEDDGIGCNVGEINKIITGENDSEYRYHLGIRNVATRIKATYGGECGLTYAVSGTGGTVARICLEKNT